MGEYGPRHKRTIFSFIPPRALHIYFNGNSVRALCQRGQIRHLTSLKNSVHGMSYNVYVPVREDTHGIGASNVPGVNKQSLLKS